jgi:hypothetical protein
MGMCLKRRAKLARFTHEREQMRAALRLRIGLLAAALMLGPAPALAQDASETSTNTPATDSIGPRELQNFSLQGTVTRPAEPPATVRAQPESVAQANSVAANRTAAASPPPRAAAAPASSRETSTAQRDEEPSRAASEAGQAPSVAVALPKVRDDLASSPTAASSPAPTPGFSPDAEAAGSTLAPEHRFPIVPWLFATLAVVAGLGFLFWRNRTREAFAGGPAIDAFVAPEAPAPRAPTPPPPAVPPGRPAPSIPGLVSTRLRPWIDFGFQPLRCIFDERQLAIEFELELFNSGSAPARAVLVEATLFNAGPNQDEEIQGFFANPVGEGERIVAIPPLKRITLRTQVAVAREHVRFFEAGGRQLFVPLIAFNALYSWGGGEGQSSISYLIGRDTKGEKMSPFRADLGPRIFRGLGSRLLPRGVRK